MLVLLPSSSTILGLSPKTVDTLLTMLFLWLDITRMLMLLLPIGLLKTHGELPGESKVMSGLLLLKEEESVTLMLMFLIPL